MRMMAVRVGAVMVGSIKTTVEEGELVKRGEEFGYFALGMYQSQSSLMMSYRFMWLYNCPTI
jgi:phosphatidylserine decarboxylase